MANRFCGVIIGCLLIAGGCAREPAGLVGEEYSPQVRTMRSSGPDLPARGNMVEPSAVIPADFTNSSEVEVYGNFHTAGVVVGLPEGADAQAVGQMRAYLNIGGDWNRVQDPVQVGRFPWYASSLFWLEPAGTYQVKVEVTDPAGDVQNIWYGEGATRAEPVLHASGPKRYVATEGDDANPGTLTKPLRTLARALALVQPGESVVVRRGTYYEGGLRPSASGTAKAPVVLRAYPGEDVIVSGANPEALDPAGWTRESDGLLSWPGTNFHAGVCIEDLETARMIRLFHVSSREELDNGRINGFGTFAALGIEGGVYADGARIHVRLPAGVQHFRIHLPQQAFGMDLKGQQHVQVDGLTFTHNGLDQPSTTIHLENVADILIQNCAFRFVDCQIYVKGASDRITVQDNVFIDAILEWPFGHMKQGGPARYYEGGAVNVDASYSGRGLVVRRNHIEGLFDGLHLTPWVVCDARTSETDCYENTMDGCIDDFIELDGFSRNVRVFDNYFKRSLSGISLAQALDGPTYIAYNVLADCGMVPAATREGNYGYPFKTNGGPDVKTGSGPIYFYHNTAYTQDPESRAMLVKMAKWRLITMRNNVWSGQRYGAEFWRNEISPMDFDYDNLHVANTNAPLMWVGYEHRLAGLPEVRQRFGWLANGLSADPRLRSPSQGDFRLRDDSPCIDAGTVVAGINETRMRGLAPDLGAYEAR